MNDREGVEGVVDFVVEALTFDSGGVTAWEGVRDEGWAPFHLDFFDKGDVDVFAGDGFAAQTGVKGEEVGDVFVEEGEELGELGCLLGVGEAFVGFEGGAHGVAAGRYRGWEGGMGRR